VNNGNGNGAEGTRSRSRRSAELLQEATDRIDEFISNDRLRGCATGVMKNPDKKTIEAIIAAKEAAENLTT